MAEEKDKKQIGRILLKRKLISQDELDQQLEKQKTSQDGVPLASRLAQSGAVSETEVVLPRGLCMPRPVVVAPRDITAIYFLRRSVPWNRTAPVLIIELGERAMAFPRDWFASEAEQRIVFQAVLSAKGEAAPASAGDAA